MAVTMGSPYYPNIQNYSLTIRYSLQLYPDHLFRRVLTVYWDTVGVFSGPNRIDLLKVKFKRSTSHDLHVI